MEKRLTPFEHQELIKSQISSSIGGQALTDTDLEKSATNFFEKGRKAVDGEIRELGGRNFIKTKEGWKKR